jgi:hypothetical protein
MRTTNIAETFHQRFMVESPAAHALLEGAALLSENGHRAAALQLRLIAAEEEKRYLENLEFIEATERFLREQKEQLKEAQAVEEQVRVAQIFAPEHPAQG